LTKNGPDPLCQDQKIFHQSSEIRKFWNLKKKYSVLEIIIFQFFLKIQVKLWFIIQAKKKGSQNFGFCSNPLRFLNLTKIIVSIYEVKVALLLHLMLIEK